MNVMKIVSAIMNILKYIYIKFLSFFKYFRWFHLIFFILIAVIGRPVNNPRNYAFSYKMYNCDLDKCIKIICQANNQTQLVQTTDLWNEDEYKKDCYVEIIINDKHVLLFLEKTNKDIDIIPVRVSDKVTRECLPLFRAQFQNFFIYKSLFNQITDNIRTIYPSIQEKTYFPFQMDLVDFFFNVHPNWLSMLLYFLVLGNFIIYFVLKKIAYDLEIIWPIIIWLLQKNM